MPAGLADAARVVDEALTAFDPELLSVKPDRSAVEYLWTSTPSLPLYMFAARPELDAVASTLRSSIA